MNLRTLLRENNSKIVFVIADGLGGIGGIGTQEHGTELEVARTPHLDRLARQGTTGVLIPVEPVITPGSGPGHLAINTPEDEQEADRILEWLKKEINQTWENRDAITPCYTGKAKPVLMEILKLLPKTNYKKCGATHLHGLCRPGGGGGPGRGALPGTERGKANKTVRLPGRFRF